MKIECENCIKRKTMYCPNSSECLDTENKPYYQNRIMLLEENQKYKEVIDKLNKKIKVIKQYDFDKVGRYELLDILKEME